MVDSSWISSGYSFWIIRAGRVQPYGARSGEGWSFLCDLCGFLRIGKPRFGWVSLYDGEIPLSVVFVESGGGYVTGYGL